VQSETEESRVRHYSEGFSLSVAGVLLAITVALPQRVERQRRGVVAPATSETAFTQRRQLCTSTS
jgi:hypothetical protein